MAFPVMNAEIVSMIVNSGRSLGASDNKAELSALSFPLFQVPAVVDVSGMEMGIATCVDAATGILQTIASGTTTVVYKPHDGNTNAGGATDNNEFFAVTDFSNSATGAASWTVVHGAMRNVGTSTTDLDADDWTNLDLAIVGTGAVGQGVMAVSAAFIFGKPAAIN